MTIEKRPAELLAVWQDDGKSIKGVALWSHLYVDGQYMKTTEPEPLTGIDDPIVAKLAEQFNAAAVQQLQVASEQVNLLSRMLKEVCELRDAAVAESERLRDHFADYEVIKGSLVVAETENVQLKKDVSRLTAIVSMFQEQTDGQMEPQ